MKNFINSYDRVKNAIETKKAINIFNLVDGDFFGMESFEYSDEAAIILELVAKNGEGFVVDICTRVLESIREGRKVIILSDKQRWCIAFAAVKMNAGLVEDLRKADEQFVAEAEGEIPSGNVEAENDASETSTTFAVVAFCGNGDSQTFFESEKKEEALIKYAEELNRAGEPIDTSEWGNFDQGWKSLYHIELLKMTIDNDGEILEEESIKHSEHYSII